MRFHERLRQFRVDAGLSQSAMAERLGMPQSNYSRAERGLTRIRVDQMVVIAKKLGIPVHDLIGDDNPSAMSGQEHELLLQFRRLHPAFHGVVVRYTRDLADVAEGLAILRGDEGKG